MTYQFNQQILFLPFFTIIIILQASYRGAC